MIFYEFTLGDVADPDIYAAGPIYDWQKTEHGQWVMSHCKDLTYQIYQDFATFGNKVSLHGSLTADDEVYYTLKYK